MAHVRSGSTGIVSRAQPIQHRTAEAIAGTCFLPHSVPEYNEAASDENAILRGTRMEEACAPKLNTGMFAAMKESGDVMGIFVDMIMTMIMQ